MSYALFYVEENEKEADVVEVKKELFEDFVSAVERYTLLCGCGLCSVVLANTDTDVIVRQFFKDDGGNHIIIH
ncbi:MAG: hypothetical protein E7505_05375 [Ruminococcus sp.]|nr:hypothetical protein [Ruminococcus sp.]